MFSSLPTPLWFLPILCLAPSLILQGFLETRTDVMIFLRKCWTATMVRLTASSSHPSIPSSQALTSKRPWIKPDNKVVQSTHTSYPPTYTSNPPTSLPTNIHIQSTNQPANHPINHPTNQLTKKPNNQPTKQHTYPTRQPANQPTNKPTYWYLGVFLVEHRRWVFSPPDELLDLILLEHIQMEGNSVTFNSNMFQI